jgi:transcriptional regulator with XRE-family HTH domain
MQADEGGALMDIGSKIKKARVAAQLTQEQSAEAIGVSRQTLSNWENNKTYPDIVSVIKMSDVYEISLDHLLKDTEEKTMSNYIDYLEESTNTVKNHRNLSQIVLISTYLGIWVFSLIVFWFFISPTDAMGYSLVFLYMILPITMIVISLFIGKNNHFGKWKWLLPIISGVMYMLAQYATFSMKNMIANDFTRINLPNFEMILIGGILTAIGLGIGSLIYHRKSKNKDN